MSDAPKRGFPARMFGAVMLRSAVYDELAADGRATLQATLVVVVVSLAASTQDYGLGWVPMAWVAAVSLLQWLFWALIAYQVGCDLLGGQATVGALVRTLGFARLPGLLVVLGPVVGGIHIAAHLWTLVAGVVAVRQACGFGTVRAVITTLCGIVPYWIVVFLVLN